MSDKPEIRYCKKCGCELTSTNTKKLCENCRRTRNKAIKDAALCIGGAALSVGLFVITGGKGGGLKKK